MEEVSAETAMMEPASVPTCALSALNDLMYSESTGLSTAMARLLRAMGQQQDHVIPRGTPPTHRAAEGQAQPAGRAGPGHATARGPAGQAQQAPMTISAAEMGNTAR